MSTGQERHRLAYPVLPDPLEPHDLKQSFTPWRDEIEWAFDDTLSEKTRLGLLVLLKIFEALGRFISPSEIPPEIIRHVARCAGLTEKDSIEYVPRTLYRHHRKVRAFLGITEWNSDAHHIAETTMEQLASARAQPADLINGAVEALVREYFELPAMSFLRRMAGIVQQRTNDSLFNSVASHLTIEHREALDAILEVPAEAKESPFASLCRTPGRATAKNLKALTEHLNWLETLAVPKSALADITPVKLELWADEARRLIATELKEYRAPRRYALLVALIHITRGRILSDQVTMLLKFMRKIQHQAEADLRSWLDERQAPSEQLIVILLDLARAHQDSGAQGFHHKAASIFATAGGSDQVEMRCEARLKNRVRNWRPFARKHFVNRRSALMDLAAHIPLKARPGSQELLQALRMIVSMRSDRDEWIDVRPKLDIACLPRSWQIDVSDPDQVSILNRRLLEVAVFFGLAQALQSGEIYVPGSDNFDSYSDHLFAIESNPQTVSAYLKARGLPDNAKDFVKDLREWLARHIHDIDRLREEGLLQLNAEGKPIVRRAPANKPPKSALALEKVLLDRLPRRSILEALYNTNHWTQWTRHFGPPTRVAPQIDDPSQRYVLTVFAHGSGLGSTQASRHFKETVAAHLLTFANRRHISTDNLRAASNDVINLYAEFGLPLCWGSGASAAADGSLLETYEKNLFAAHHVRYRRSGGIAYRHVADTYIALFTHFIPCGVHEAIYILDGLLKNPSKIQPSRLNSDTHGQSATVFGLSHLLGIELMPRIRNWRSLKLYRIRDPDRSRSTQSLYSGTINWALIEAHWDEYLRVVLAIQTGRVSSSWVLARLNRHSRSSGLFLAFQELGRVVRTVYLLRWIVEDTLRVDVTDGANKVESFHEFSDFLNFGGRGVLRTNDPGEQEKLAVYNQLIANAVMLQNVVDQTSVLHELHREGYPIDKDDLAFMSPYVTRNLNRFGDIETRYNTETAPVIKELPL